MKKIFIILLGLILLATFQLTVKAQSTNTSASVSTNTPKPTGFYPTGTAIFQLTDSTRKDFISKEPDRFREIMIQVWYPAKSVNKTQTAPYIPDSRLLQVMKEEKYLNVDENTLDAWKSIRTNSVLDAPLSNKQSKFPLLLLSPGRGSSRSNYTMLAEELASYGYIVVCIDHPYTAVTTLPDGRVISSKQDARSTNASNEIIKELVQDASKDASFILNQLSSNGRSNPTKKFYKYIDRKRIGMLGHSLGGITAFEVCRTDNRFKACANLDAIFPGKDLTGEVKTPSLIIRSNPVYSDEDLAKRRLSREQWDKTFQGFKALFESMLPKQKNVPGYIVMIKGTEHISFNDAPFVMPSKIISKAGHIDYSRGFMIMSHYIRSFFDKHLKSEGRNVLDEINSPYSEVAIDRFN